LDPFTIKTPVLYHPRSLAIILAGLILLACQGFTQDTDQVVDGISREIPQVRWVKQWPSTDTQQKSHRFRNRFNAIFLGKKTPVLTRPFGLVANNPENFWILDQGVGSLFHVREDVGDIPQLLQKSRFDFSSLVGICAFQKSGVLFTDSHANKIYLFLPDKKQLQILNDSLLLDQPTGIAYSPLKNEIWVVETNAHRIAVLNESGKIIRHIGSRGTDRGEFNYPTHIWIDKKGVAYIVDAMNFRLQVLNSSGEVISVFGKPGDASGYFARPKGVATDSHGNIFVVDAVFHVVQIFDLQGKLLSQLGQQGHGEGEFWMPSGIYIDDKDFIYVADCYNARVQVFQMVYAGKQ
jgi:DNA-binding beta-propeller fold protein YncE